LSTNGSLPPAKQLAGPPSEFHDHQIPSPTVGALHEQSAYFEVRYQQSKDRTDAVSWSVDLPVDSTKAFGVSVFSPQQLQIVLKDQKGNPVPDLDKYAHEGEFPIGLHAVPETTYLFTADLWEQPIQGVWSLELSMSGLDASTIEKLLANDQTPNGAVLLWNLSPVKGYSRLNTYNLKAGQQVGLLTTVTDKTRASKYVDATPMADVIMQAEMDIYLPDGEEEFVKMHDDGLHGDGEANDGIFGASIPATEVGVYRAFAVIKGTTADGTAFIRSTQHLIPVVADKISFVGTASGTVDNTHMKINLPVQLNGPFDDNNPVYRVYSEVWGKDDLGNDVPICWLSTMAPVHRICGAYFRFEVGGISRCSGTILPQEGFPPRSLRLCSSRRSSSYPNYYFHQYE